MTLWPQCSLACAWESMVGCIYLCDKIFWYFNCVESLKCSCDHYSCGWVNSVVLAMLKHRQRKRTYQLQFLSNFIQVCRNKITSCNMKSRTLCSGGKHQLWPHSSVTKPWHTLTLTDCFCLGNSCWWFELAFHFKHLRTCGLDTKCWNRSIKHLWKNIVPHRVFYAYFTLGRWVFLLLSPFHKILK